MLDTSGKTTSKTRTQLHPSKKNETAKNMLQTKQQGKNLQDQTNEEETDNLSGKEFRVMIVKMIQNLRNRMETRIKKMQEMFNKDLEELKNKQ